MIEDPFGYGQRAVDFLRGLKHPKSRRPDKAFQLDPWQEGIVRRIYGPCDEHGNRIVQSVVILVPRGARKTSLAAALTLLHTHGPEAVLGGEVLLGASDKKQAKIGLDEATGVIQATWGDMWRKGQAARLTEASSGIRDQSYKNRVIFPNCSFLEALSNDAGTQHGRTPIFALCDEIHAWKKRELWDVIDTGLAKIDNSLRVTITTSGRGQENLAYEVIEHARKVARGDVIDPSTLAILYETSANADWKDETVWHAANPGLRHGYPSLAGLRRIAREAEHKPAVRDAFRNLHLNVWLDHSETPFVEMAIFDQGRAEIDDTALNGQPCWVAVDCSTTQDLTAVLAIFREEDTKSSFIAKAWGFVPADNLSKRADRDGVPYPRWSEDGWIRPTPGNVIDYRAVEQFIRQLCDRFDVREIVFDPAYAQQIMGPLTDDGLPTATMRQGWVTQSPALNLLEAAIIGRKLKWDSPVLRWCVQNVAIHTDSAGNRTMHKGKSKDRIDLAVTLWMALARASANETPKTALDDPELDRIFGLEAA
jgi:phage terminase large subunit-like protein